MNGRTLQKLVNAGCMKCLVPFGDGKAIAYILNGKLLAWDRPDGKFWVHRHYKVA